MAVAADAECSGPWGWGGADAREVRVGGGRAAVAVAAALVGEADGRLEHAAEDPLDRLAIERCRDGGIHSESRTHAVAQPASSEPGAGRARADAHTDAGMRRGGDRGSQPALCQLHEGNITLTASHISLVRACRAGQPPTKSAPSG